MNEMIQGFEIPELLILLGLGIAVLFFGYRIKKFAFFIAWFLLGYMGTSYFMPEITKISPEVLSTQLYQILIPIAGGLLLALLGFSIEKLCVGGICFALVMVTSIQYFGSSIQTIAISAVVAVIIAALAVTLLKPATIVATSGVGAYVITLALLALIPSIDRNIFYWPMLIGLTAVGSLFQFATTKHTS